MRSRPESTPCTAGQHVEPGEVAQERTASGGEDDRVDLGAAPSAQIAVLPSSTVNIGRAVELEPCANSLSQSHAVQPNLPVSPCTTTRSIAFLTIPTYARLTLRILRAMVDVEAPPAAGTGTPPWACSWRPEPAPPSTAAFDGLSCKR